MAYLFNVPFLPDEKYVRFLGDHLDCLAAVHFPLQPESPFDARHPAGHWNHAELAAHLKQCQGPLRYALLNTRVVPSSFYRDTGELRQLAARLDDLLSAALLDGLIIADLLLLQALSRYAPDLAAALEAVPSVNCLLSSFDRIAAVLEIIEASHFRFPTKIPLAPALNRQPDSLQNIAAACRQSFPGLKLELLVNEGCLYQCPFKLGHDAGIAMDCGGASNWAMPDTLGCIAALRAKPARLFKSPFIRPEDLIHYRQSADIFKICGRTLGPDFLRRTVGSYIREKHEGNLLDLFDAMNWLSRELFIDNPLLPDHFLQDLLGCDKQCRACDRCDNFLRAAMRTLPLRLGDLRGGSSES